MERTNSNPIASLFAVVALLVLVSGVAFGVYAGVQRGIFKALLAPPIVTVEDVTKSVDGGANSGQQPRPTADAALGSAPIVPPAPAEQPPPAPAVIEAPVAPPPAFDNQSTEGINPATGGRMIVQPQAPAPVVDAGLGTAVIANCGCSYDGTTVTILSIDERFNVATVLLPNGNKLGVPLSELDR